MGKLQDKVAIVTGAARGLGKGIADKLCLEGAKVVVVDMNEDICKGTVEELSKNGYTAASFVANIAKEDDVKDLFKFTIEKFGTVDILVNNAGINRDSTLNKMTLEDSAGYRCEFNRYFFMYERGSKIYERKRIWENYIHFFSSLAWKLWSSKLFCFKSRCNWFDENSIQRISKK